MSDPEPLGVAIVGWGAAGRQHARAIEGSGAFRLMAVADPDPRARADAPAPAADHRPRVYTDLDSALGDERVDLVALCTPPGPRAGLAKAAIAAGRNVLLEKPPVASVRELHQLAAAAETAGVAAGVMLQHRFRLPREARSAVWPGGAVATVEVARPRSPAHFLGSPWRADGRAALGGALAHLAVHQLDLCCQLLGVPERVVGFLDALPGHPEIDTRAALAVRFRSGALATVLATTDASPPVMRLIVNTATSRLLIDQDGTTLTTDSGTTVSAAPDNCGLRRRVYDDLAQAIRSGGQPATSALAAAEGVVRLLELARERLDHDPGEPC